MQILFRLLLLLTSVAGMTSADEFEALKDVPTSYKGRYRPLDSEARLWREDLSHHGNEGSSIDMLWKMHFLGHSGWDDIPLFGIGENKFKVLLDLPADKTHFTYNQLNKAIYENKETNQRLMQILLTYHFLKSYRDPANRSRSEKQELTSLSPGLWVMFDKNALVVAAVPKNAPWNHIEPGLILHENGRSLNISFEKSHKKTAEEAMRVIAAMQHYASMLASEPIPESQNPVFEQLSKADSVLRVLPSRRGEGEWLPLKALNLRIHDPKSNRMVPVGNFTLYPDDQFQAIQKAYFELTAAFQKPSSDEHIQSLTQELGEQLKKAYAPLAGTIYKEANGKTLRYPSIGQLQMEKIYYDYPFAFATMAFYGLALLLFLFSYLFKKEFLDKFAMTSLILAFCLHTILLGLRCYILQRPPVSNMFETVIYVPWIAVATGFVLYFFLHRRITLIAGAIVALVLLSILELAHINKSLENVQAVLDSQYWLIIHVLLVVGSYGTFALCGILGHFYLGGLMISKQETPSIKFIGNCILQSMYLGLAMLIPGTILGGVWAAESWGRFWDWDPKEAWAFISICTYLICVHAYRFNHIQHFGLAMGSIIGLQVISFTWYGVNYILGTGLHSYGFGSGGDLYYYSFLIGETIFLTLAWRCKKSIDKKKFYDNLIG